MRAFIFVLLAQFFSAFADNFLFIVAIAQLKHLYGSQSSLLPFLQEAFVIAFIALAPFVGVFADKFAKNNVMLIANAIKFFGVVLMLFGVDVLFAYLVVGIGAAIYSPAKYGILVQILSKEMLVRANGMLEGSTIFAILSGVLVGGFAVDMYGIEVSFFIVACLYIAALGLTLFIGYVEPEFHAIQMSMSGLMVGFFSSMMVLIRDKKTKIALIGTSSFWGLGSMLRVFLFMWIPYMYSIDDTQTPSYFMGVLSIGIVFGAIIAGKFYHLHNAANSIKYGVFLAIVLVVISFCPDMYVAMGIFIFIGLFGGIFVIPLNALVQEKGHESIGAGSALAVQNFFENLSMLFFVGIFNIALVAKIPMEWFLVGVSVMFGVLMFTLMRSNEHPYPRV